MIGADEALARLKEGNRAFAAGMPAELDARARRELADGQSPFAVVLGCSDSRVPVEAVFRCRIGELFVVRVAGNIAAPSQIGSVEFAAENLGVRLAVVLGHSRCGAVDAAIGRLRRPDTRLSPGLDAVVERIRPGIESLVGRDADDGETLARAVRANIAATVSRLEKDSAALAGLVEKGRLRIVGAEYRLESGRVEFFDEESAGGGPGQGRNLRRKR